MRDEIPTWFANAVTGGIQILFTLSLPGSPPAAEIVKTDDVWSHALWSSTSGWSEQLDAPRISAAFMALARRVERWPAPKHLLDAMPPRLEPVKLPAPPVSDEQRARNRARIRALAAMLAAKRPSAETLHDAHVAAYNRAARSA